MPRILFEKKGNAVWISHLDLMRVFQRAFKRAKMPLKHSQGFNPRPSVSIALPLSVGVESQCELLDFELDNYDASCQDIKDRLNENLISGVSVLDVYEEGRKIRHLALLNCVIGLEYDHGVPENAELAIADLFARETLTVPKKTKNGVQDQDINSMIRRLQVRVAGENTVEIDAIICCQNPTLNPMQIPLAIATYLPELTADFTRCLRVEVLDSEEKIFR